MTDIPSDKTNVGEHGALSSLGSADPPLAGFKGDTVQVCVPSPHIGVDDDPSRWGIEKLNKLGFSISGEIRSWDEEFDLDILEVEVKKDKSLEKNSQKARLQKDFVICV